MHKGSKDVGAVGRWRPYVRVCACAALADSRNANRTGSEGVRQDTLELLNYMARPSGRLWESEASVSVPLNCNRECFCWSIAATTRVPTCPAPLFRWLIFTYPVSRVCLGVGVCLYVGVCLHMERERVYFAD